MHIKTKFIAILLTLSLLSPALVSAKGRGDTSTNQQQSAQLTGAEEATLLFMREEEKLARDVYLKMYKKWDASIFNNIAKAEQNHMDALLKKIDSYGLEDSITPKTGEFNDPELQALYYDLIKQGLQSYTKALEVGATIEDLDIMDIAVAIEETDKLDMQTTYQSLLEGSKNHLRSFVNLLGEYEPQYIDQDLYDAIIAY